MFELRIARAMGKTEMYIITRRLICTAGFTSARLKLAMPVCREDTAWKIAAATRGPAARVATASFFQSRTMMSSVSMKLSTIKMPHRAHVVPLGNNKV